MIQREPLNFSVLHFLLQKMWDWNTLFLEFLPTSLPSTTCKDISRIYLEIRRTRHNVKFVPSCSLFPWLPGQKSLANTKSNQNFKNSTQQKTELKTKSKFTLNLNNWGEINFLDVNLPSMMSRFFLHEQPLIFDIILQFMRSFHNH